MNGSFYPQILADTTVVPKPTDKVLVEGSLKDPQLRIRLSSVLGNKFLNASGTSNLATNEDFVNFFKGLYVSIENPSQTSGQGSILHFNLLSSETKFSFFSV